MPFPCDVNVLIACVDPRHEPHDRVLRWERLHAGESLVTCPLTENGFLRIYGHPNYPGGPGSPLKALVEIECLRCMPVHRFVPDSLSLAEELSDLYLLGLAVQHGLSFLRPTPGSRPGCCAAA